MPLLSAPIPHRRRLPVTRAADGREIAPNRIIVGYQPGVSATDKDAVRRTVIGRSAVTITSAKPIGDHADVVEVSGKTSLDDAIASYQADARVRYAEPDYVMHALETPDDANFPQRYGMTKIQAPPHGV
jgi:thermitase